MKKLLIVGLVIVLSIGLIGCNPFSESEVEVTIERHPDSGTLLNSNLSNFEIGGNVIGSGLPQTVILETGNHNASWVYDSSFGERTYNDNVEIKEDVQTLKLKRTGASEMELID